MSWASLSLYLYYYHSVSQSLNILSALINLGALLALKYFTIESKFPLIDTCSCLLNTFPFVLKLKLHNQYANPKVVYCCGNFSLLINSATVPFFCTQYLRLNVFPLDFGAQCNTTNEIFT
jgi:hypothetical protein